MNTASSTPAVNFKPLC